MMMKFPQKRGEFTLLRKIGEGGMAEVFLAEREGDEDFKTLVALKRLHGGFALDQYFIRQLVQEAKLLGQLQHTNIVRVNDLRRIDDDYYIVMEYIDGIDVAQAIKVHRDKDLRFPLSIFFHIALSLCEALDFAHSATDMDGKPIRLIHRDIKPSNVLISNRGIVKLTDFGIARVGDTSNTGSVVKGTANYMSPEQASGEQNLTPASDIFSLGAVFWEMLTLEKLVEGSNYLTVINSIKDLNVGLKDITKKGIEPGLRMILLRMLARKRELRYQSMGLVLKDLRFVAEQMKVDLSPSHLREYMAKITNLAREAAGSLPSGTNLATAKAPDDDDVPTPVPAKKPAAQPAAKGKDQEAAFAESVAALKALVLKDTESKGGMPAAPAQLNKEAPKKEAKAAPPPPPKAPPPKVEAPKAEPPKAAAQTPVPDDALAVPSAMGLAARDDLAKASKVSDRATTTPGGEAPKAPEEAKGSKKSRKQKKREKREKAAAGVAGVAAAATAGAAAKQTGANTAPVPPAGVPTPPMKPKAAAPPPKPAPPPASKPAPKPALAPAATGPKTAPPQPPVPRRPAPTADAAPVMEMVDEPGTDDPYDDDYDDDWEGASNTALYAAIAVVVLLLIAVIWLMLPGSDDPGGDAVVDGTQEPAEPTAAPEEPEDEPDMGGEVVADTGDQGDQGEEPTAEPADEPEDEPEDSGSAVVASTSGSRSDSSGSVSGSRSSGSSSRSSDSYGSSSRPSDTSSSSRSSGSTGSSRASGSSSSSGSRSSGSSSRSSDSYGSSSRSSDTSSSGSSRSSGSSSSSSRSSGSSSSSSEPTYTGSSSSSSSSSADEEDDWATASSDTRDPYDEPVEDDPVEDDPIDDEPDDSEALALAVASAPSPQQVLDDYGENARRGRLAPEDIDNLRSIPPAAASYENSRAVLMAQYEATGESAQHCSTASEVLGQPGNYADPQWNLEMSKCHLREGRFEDALQSSRVAELHAQDIPARSRTDRQLKIWEIQAKSYKGLYQATENLDYLSDAIAVWKRYRHMANNTYRPREATKADEAIVALQDLSEGAL